MYKTLQIKSQNINTEQNKAEKPSYRDVGCINAKQ